ncbi:MAG TPA: pitrilysin family protein [Polyangia bacterium]|nr:pitrilysin family protein [Polyangia bacterium]
MTARRARAQTPAPPPPPSVVRAKGPGGSLLIVEENRTIPIVHLVIASRSGAAVDPRHREGLTNLAAEMALRGAGGKTREQLDTALDSLGATLEVHTDRDHTRFEGEVLARNLDAYLALLGDVLLRPTFAPAELARTKRELVAQLEELRTDDHALCGRYFARNVYGDHPYGHPPEGLAAAIEATTPAEVAAHFKRHFVGRNLIVAASGDVDAADFGARLARAWKGMRDLAAPGVDPLELRAPVPPKGWRIQLVDKPERQQAQVMFGHPVVPASDPDYLPLELGLAAFGGHGMTATLMDEVRTKRGLAYGAYMSMSERRAAGAVSGWVFSGTDKTVATLKLSLKLYVALMDKGLTTERIEAFRKFLIGSHAADMDAPAHRLDARVTAEIAGLPADWVDTYAARLGAIKPAAVNAALKRHVHARDLAITMVATASVMKPLLVGAKIKDSAIDVVPFDSY